MGRTSAQLLLTIASSMSFTGCLIPPEGQGVDLLGPYPPKVDLARLFPAVPRTQLGRNCGGEDAFQLSAENIVDLDTQQLLFRWVANNDVDNTKFLDDDQSTQAPGLPHSVTKTYEHGIDLGFDPNDTQIRFFSGVVSLFVTDAPAWAVDPNLNRGEKRNLGRIDNPEELFTVVEVRWTFEYSEDFNGICEPRD